MSLFTELIEMYRGRQCAERYPVRELPLEKDLSQVVRCLAKALREDPDLFHGYQSNIAMEFVDRYRGDSSRYKNINAIHSIANSAAASFLRRLIDLSEDYEDLAPIIQERKPQNLHRLIRI